MIAPIIGYIAQTLRVKMRPVMPWGSRRRSIKATNSSVASPNTGPVANVTDDQIRQAVIQRVEDFKDKAPMTAAEASKVILDGVREERWRILVGKDAHALDRLVREDPELAYEPSFMERLLKETEWQLGG